MISRAVVREWKSGLASFSNWRVQYQPWVCDQFQRLLDHADRALGGGRDHHLGAEEAHQLPPLDAERLGHGQDARIALRRADHGEADAGIAAGRLDDRLAGLQFARLLAPPR